MAAPHPSSPPSGKETLIHQNAYTGLFYAIRNDGRHAPASHSLIREQAPSMQRLKYWRSRYGHTQSELAENLHGSGKTIIEMRENGSRHPLKKHRQLTNAEPSPDIFPD